MTHVARISNSEPGTGTGRGRPLASGGSQLHALAGEDQFPRLALQTHWRNKELDLDAFSLCRFDFLHEARHLAAGAAVEHLHRLRAQAHRAAAGVHSRVAAAYYDDVTPHDRRRSIGEFLKELQCRRGQLFARAAQAARALRANGQEHGVEVPPQVVQGEVSAQPFAQAELGAQVANHSDLRIEHLPRQPKRRDAIAQHPSRLRVRVKQHRAMTLAQQMMRRGQPRRARPDDGDALGRSAAGVPPGAGVGSPCRRAGAPPRDWWSAAKRCRLRIESASSTSHCRQRCSHSRGQTRPSDAGKVRSSVTISVASWCRPRRFAAMKLGMSSRARASGLAGADAIARMVGEQQFERGLARRAHLVRVVDHDHSLRRGRGARGPEVGPSFDLHRA